MWLTSALGAEVNSFDVADIGVGVGIFGEIVRVTLRGASTLPDTVIAKFPTREPANRAVGDALGIYAREVRFFRQVVPQSSLRAPDCYVAELDPATGASVLLLEDLARFRMGEQLAGVSPADARCIVDGLVGLHAAWWDTPELHALGWLPTSCDPTYLATVPPIYAAGLPVLEQEWGERVGADAVALARRIAGRFEDVMRRTATGQTTVLHGDARIDNFFFDDGTPIFIDFQLSVRGRGPHDLAYLVGTSMNVEDQRTEWQPLLRRYHEALGRAGVTDYPWEQCLRDYRESLLFLTVGAMSLIATFGSGNERGAAMSEALTIRMFRHAVECEAEREL